MLALSPQQDATGAYRRNDQVVEANRLLAALAGQDPAVAFLDLTPHVAGPDGRMRADLLRDGLHPNEAGYQALTAAVRPALDALLAAAQRSVEAMAPRGAPSLTTSGSSFLPGARCSGQSIPRASDRSLLPQHDQRHPGLEEPVWPRAVLEGVARRGP